MFQALAEMRRCNHSFLSIELCFVSFLSDCVTEISLRQPQAGQNRLSAMSNWFVFNNLCGKAARTAIFQKWDQNGSSGFVT